MARVLVVGGTGTLGTFITRRLLTTGTSVRVMSRHSARAAALRTAGAEVVEGDLLDRESLVRACADTDAVVAAAHSMLGRGANASHHVDLVGHRTLIDAAKAAGIRYFVYTSVFDHGPANRRIPLFRIKFDVERDLKASGIPCTILRPTAFMDFHAHVLIGKPILETGRVVLIGRGEQPRNFVAADDVAQLVVLALSGGSLIGETVDIGGPENLTAMDVVRLYERLTSRRAAVVRVPRRVAAAMSHVVRPFHPGLSQVLQTAVMADSADQQFDAGPFERRFPIGLTRLEDWVAQKVTHAGGPRAGDAESDATPGRSGR
jgi:uncharacterized protein YbjT (DUF2867 family)